MNTYYLRTTDMQTLVDTALQANAITQAEGILSATEGGCWDTVGIIYQPTGDYTKGEFCRMPVMQSIKDENGTPYLHVNLRTPLNLDEALAAFSLAKPANPYRIFAGD
jgi:hypothetical protein